jgi:hypothetical protein
VRFASCIGRRGAWVSWFVLKTKLDGFSEFGFKIVGFRFPSLGLKTNSYALLIWALKSPGQFLGLGLKTKRASVSRLCHKTDERMKMVRACIEI